MCLATIRFYSFKFFNLKYEGKVINLIQKKNLIPSVQLKRFLRPNFYSAIITKKFLPISPPILARTYLRYKARVLHLSHGSGVT